VKDELKKKVNQLT